MINACITLVPFSAAVWLGCVLIQVPWICSWIGDAYAAHDKGWQLPVHNRSLYLSWFCDTVFKRIEPFHNKGNDRFIRMPSYHSNTEKLRYCISVYSLLLGWFVFCWHERIKLTAIFTHLFNYDSVITRDSWKNKHNRYREKQFSCKFVKRFWRENEEWQTQYMYIRLQS